MAHVAFILERTVYAVNQLKKIFADDEGKKKKQKNGQ